VRRARRAVLFATLVLSACGGMARPAPTAPLPAAAPSTTSGVISPVGAPIPPIPGLATTTTATTPSSPCSGAPRHASYLHVVWIWMENHQSVLENSAAGYERGLARACGSGSDDASVGSPSLPNYLGATSGSTWGVADDSGPDAHPITADNLFRQVRAEGGTERSYEEAMPGPCSLGSDGEYAVKHNPAAYYVGAGDRAACTADDVPLGTLTSGPLARDIAAGTLPTFAFITPDLCNDTHDCGVGVGDQWLSQWIPPLLAGPNYRSGQTVIVIAWDEPTPMSEIVVGPSVPPGTVVSARTDHYALLRATEELLGLPLLGHAATAVDLRPLYGL